MMGVSEFEVPLNTRDILEKGLTWVGSSRSGRKDFEEAVKITVKKTRHHEPDMEKHAIYQKNYETYLEIYENLKETMKKTGGV